MELIKAGRTGKIGNKYLFECETCGAVFKAAERECSKSFIGEDKENYRTKLNAQCPCCGDYQEITIEEEKPWCNMCGKIMDIIGIENGIHVKKPIGFGSIHDGGKLDIHICCDCMDDLIDKCDIYPVSGEEFDF